MVLVEDQPKEWAEALMMVPKLLLEAVEKVALVENLVATELEAGAEGDRSDIGNQWDGPTTYASAAQFSRQQPCVFCFMQCSFGLDSEVNIYVILVPDLCGSCTRDELFILLV